MTNNTNGKSMNLPKFNETFLPILEVLKDGKIIKGRDLIRIIEERFYSSLPAHLLEQTTKSGDRVIENRIAWGKSYLKKGGLVHYCLLYTSPSPRDRQKSRMPSSA